MWKEDSENPKGEKGSFYQFVNYLKHLLEMPQTFDTTMSNILI